MRPRDRNGGMDWGKCSLTSLSSWVCANIARIVQAILFAIAAAAAFDGHVAVSSCLAGRRLPLHGRNCLEPRKPFCVGLRCSTCPGQIDVNLKRYVQ